MVDLRTEEEDEGEERRRRNKILIRSFIVYFSRQAIRSSFNSLPLWRRGSHFQMWRLSYKPPGLLVICELRPQTQRDR